MREAFGGLGWIFPSIWGASLPPKCSAFRQHVIGFCGNIYPALEFERGEQQTFCYSAESVDAWFRENLSAAAFNEYMSARAPRHYRYRIGSTHAYVQRYFRQCEEEKGKFAQMFVDRGSPIFAAHYEGREGEPSRLSIEWNALLKPYEFFRKFDVHQTYQELRMYLSNLAMPEKPIPQLSNEDLAASKGHGDKYSFRRAPSK